MTQDPSDAAHAADPAAVLPPMPPRPPAHAKTPQQPARLPSALDRISDLIVALKRQRRRLAFFLDYDGTLSPIVDDPDSATLPARTRDALAALAARFPTAIVTGRSRSKVMDMVRVEHLVYAASHGFDIHAPDGRVAPLRVAHDFLPTMQAAVRDLRRVAARTAGAVVEDNGLSVSMHYRHVAGGAATRGLFAEVDAVAAAHGLRRHDGKMVLELRPPTDWHKGKAVEYLLGALQLGADDVVPIYIGDDVADETAFEALHGRGISVVVADDSTERCTSADMRLRDPAEVGKFLMQLATDC